MVGFFFYGPAFQNLIPIQYTEIKWQPVFYGCFHDIIIARAKMYYAENEDAPEIMVGSLSEFEDLLDKLEN